MTSTARSRFPSAAALALAGGLALAAAEPKYVPGTDPEKPRLEFDDGQISVNDRCPVRRAKLNPKIAPLWVNGRPLGFC